jgi:hypothetical protein
MGVVELSVLISIMAADSVPTLVSPAELVTSVEAKRLLLPRFKQISVESPKKREWLLEKYI